MLFLTPLNRQVIQRDNKNAAVVSFSGTYTRQPNKIRVRLVPIKANQGVVTDWLEIPFQDGSFSGKITARGGWYSLEAENLNDSGVAQETASVAHFGIGEVFITAGHSVAAGGVSYINGASDDRVIAIPMEIPFEVSRRGQTGSLEDMPPIKFAQFGTGVADAPFGYNCYFWSKFAELVVERLNVPVLMYQTAFGGTNLQHWADSSQGIEFPLFSVPPAWHMPYINLKHTIQKYIPVTGLRAVLVDHGQNDYPEKDEDLLLNRYLTWVNQARTDVGQSTLAFVINRQTPFLTVDPTYQGLGPQVQIRHVQEKMSVTPNCFAGPDYDTGLVVADRFDNIHLSDSGQAKAAVMWSNALTNAFFEQSIPHTLEPVTMEIPAARVVTDLPLPIITATRPATTTTVSTGGTTTIPVGTLVDAGNGSGVISATLLPNLPNLSNYALIGLILLAAGFLAFLLQQFFTKQK